MVIKDEVINKLIIIGKSFPAKAPTLRGSKSYLTPDSISYDEQTWINSLSNLSLNNLSALLKGITLVLDLEEIHPQLHRFSAMQIRWIFNYLQRKDYEENGNYDFSTYIADQLLANTDRCDVPLGSESNFGAKSFKELLKRREAYNRWSEYINEKLEERSHISEVHRELRRRQRKNTALYRGTNIQQKFIAELDKLSVEEQLIKLANDNKYSVGFYPTRLAYKANKDIIDRLSEDIKLMLLAKLKGKQKGAWGRFKKRLYKSYRKDKDYIRSTLWDRNNYI